MPSPTNSATEDSFSVPVVLCIFNRPEHTKQVFEVISRVKPRQLFIVADGPRTPEERSLVDATRAVIENVNWDCSVHRIYSEKNLGCDERVSTGITEVFKLVERAIILEDDCIPHPDFFPFCAELLEKYEHDERIMNICGDNFQQKNSNFVCSESYYFSVIPHISGWATWRRAWDTYDSHLERWPEIKRRELLKDPFPSTAVRARFSYKFDQYYTNALTAWDGKWAFACVTHRGLSINPRVNLVTNIGYGDGATHTIDETDEKALLPIFPLPQPYVHPPAVLPDVAADAYTYLRIFGINRTITAKCVWYTKEYFPTLFHIYKTVRNFFTLLQRG